MKISFKEVIKNSKKFRSPKGFTLVELLIVIAILGILATAVLSAINPIEQINRGRDTGTQSDAEQLINAIDRYEAVQGYLPWQSSANDANSSVTFSVVATASAGTPPNVVDSATVWCVDNGTVTKGTSSDGTACTSATNNTVSPLDKMGPSGTQELLSGYISRVVDTANNYLYVYNRGQQGDTTYVCFAPKSNEFQQTASTRCAGNKPDDFPTQACPTTPSTTTPVLSCLP